MPKQLNQLNAETLQIVTKSTEEAAIEENGLLITIAGSLNFI